MNLRISISGLLVSMGLAMWSVSLVAAQARNANPVYGTADFSTVQPPRQRTAGLFGMFVNKAKAHLRPLSLMVLQLQRHFSLAGGFPLADTIVQGSSLGDELLLPFVGKKTALLIRVKYPEDDGGLFHEALVQERARIVEDAFWRNSYGRVSLSIDITPELTMPHPKSYYLELNPLEALARLRGDAVAAARQAGYNPDDYDREIIYSRKSWNSATGMGTINTRTVFLSGGTAYLDMHELGHSLGWQHADFWWVDPGQSPISSHGKKQPYGDSYDIMGDQGWGQHPGQREFHHFNPWVKWRAGWIPPENIATVTESDTYALQAYDLAPDSSRPVQKYTALRIPRDGTRDYWVFWRADEPLVRHGVVITWGFYSNMKPSILLDMQPGSPDSPNDWKDVALRVGQTFSDPEAGIEIELVEKAGNVMRVRVSRSGPPVDRLPVIDVVEPARGQTVKKDVRYAVTAYDPDAGKTDGSGIAKVRFDLIRFLGGEQSEIVGSREVEAPPYVWDFDSRELPVSVYFLEVTAVSTGGDSNTIWFPHIIDSRGVATSVADDSDQLPRQFQLYQNYPNPFNPATTIRFVLSQPEHVTLSVFDLLGRKVATLVEDALPAGEYSVMFAADDLASGIYFFQLRAGGFVQVRKAVLMK